MMRMPAFVTTVLLSVGLSTAGLVAQQGGVTAVPPPAQTQPQGQQRAGRPGGPPARPMLDLPKLQTVQDAVDGLELRNSGEFLGLTDEQYAKFVQPLRRLQDLRRRHLGQRMQIVTQLRRMGNIMPPPEDALLEGQTRKLDDFDVRAVQEIRTAFGDIDAVLTPRQRARFRLFEEQLEAQKADILTRVLKIK